MPTIRLVRVNENGRRIGEDHPAAKLTDADVDMIRDLHEANGMGYKKLAAKFRISKSQVRRICLYEDRAYSCDRVKALQVYAKQNAQHWKQGDGDDQGEG